MNYKVLFLTLSLLSSVSVYSMEKPFAEMTEEEQNDYITGQIAISENALAPITGQNTVNEDDQRALQRFYSDKRERTNRPANLGYLSTRLQTMHRSFLHAYGEDSGNA